MKDFEAGRELWPPQLPVGLVPDETLIWFSSREDMIPAEYITELVNAFVYIYGVSMLLENQGDIYKLSESPRSELANCLIFNSTLGCIWFLSST